MKLTRIFHVSDLHGSEFCFSKLLRSIDLYKPNIINVCGDLTGKAIIPIIRQKDETFVTKFLGTSYVMKSMEELEKVKNEIRVNGWYPWCTTQEELEEFKANKKKQDLVFKDLMLESVRRWLLMAEKHLKGKNVKLFLLPGNDDDFIIDQAFKDLEGDYIINPEGKVVYLDDKHEMISTGYSNTTPWNAPRDIPEEKLMEKIEDMASRVGNMSSCIFNFHCPPFNTLLDIAPKLDENLTPIMSGGSPLMGPVGSTAVRKSIEKYGPLLGLHGHIHESRGAEKINRTLCINPGSEYGEGVLRGCIINIDDKSVKSYLFTSG